jgi:hypothetical protein
VNLLFNYLITEILKFFISFKESKIKERKKNVVPKKYCRYESATNENEGENIFE